MDILKDLIGNSGLHHVAEIVIGYLDKKFARDLVGNRELLPGDDEQDFLMKTLRNPMYNEAKKICEETRILVYGYEKTILQQYPFLADVLGGLKNGECLETFKQLREILSLLEKVKYQDGRFRFIRDAEPEKGPEHVIEILKESVDFWDFNDFVTNVNNCLPTDLIDKFDQIFQRCDGPVMSWHVESDSDFEPDPYY